MVNKYVKIMLIAFLVLSGLNLAMAAQNIIDVSITERGFEEVLYNPLQATGGVYVDSNENRSVYDIYGEIVIMNNHNTESVQDTVLNISGIANIYNLTNSSGRESYIIDFNVAGDYVLILIPDLGAGQNATLSYIVNTTTIAPPLNFTASYSDSKVFSGLPITITDYVGNYMNNTLYPNNCIFDINITQNAMVINSSGILENVTYDGTSLAGTDVLNAGITTNNRTINWDLLAGACLNSGSSTDILYDVITPATISVADDYKIVNTTIKYSYNDTFSRIDVSTIDSILNLDLMFDKFFDTILTGDNATWRINGSIYNPTNITINLTTVNFWVSVRDGTGTGFTNPSIIDNDTVSGAVLSTVYTPGVLMNESLVPWSNAGSEWFFNYTFSSSPIVWMDMDNFIVDDGIQLSNRSVSYSENNIYIKEIYIATGYWLQISKNITRLGDNWYNVFVEVRNLGTSPTPSDQVVQIYNFLPIAFTLNSSFSFSSSTWYNTVSANETLVDPVYNGTMFQFGLIANINPFNSSLAAFGGASNSNNTWSMSYNVTGSGEFSYDDLFLTGVDPLHVSEYGSTQALSIEGVYGFLSSKVEVVFAVFAGVIGTLALFF